MGHYGTEGSLQGHYYFIRGVSSQDVYPDPISALNRLFASEDVMVSGDPGKNPELRRKPALEQFTQG